MIAAKKTLNTGIKVGFVVALIIVVHLALVRKWRNSVSEPLLPKREPLAIASEAFNQEMVTCNRSCTDSCVTTKTNVAFKICLHPLNADIWISRRLKENGHYESALSNTLLRFARSSGKSTYLDIGANIGIHALFMAANNIPTIAVEPAPGNIKLLTRSAAMNGLQEKMKIVPFGISSERRTVVMKMSTNNAGNSYIPDEFTRGKTKTAHSFEIRTLLLNDLLPLLPKDYSPVVMKVDVERHECEVFKGFEQFVNVVNITHIAMEWLYEYQACRQDMVDRFVRLNFVPKTMDGRIMDVKALLRRTADANLYWERMLKL